MPGNAAASASRLTITCSVSERHILTLLLQ